MPIGHVLNEQGTGYEYLKSIELKKEARHLKEHPNISKFTKFESYCTRFKIAKIRELSMDCRELSLQSILSSLILAILKRVPCLCVLTNNLLTFR